MAKGHPLSISQVIRVKWFLGNPADNTALSLEPGFGAARKEARWVARVRG